MTARHADKIKAFLGPWGFQGGELDYDGLMEIGKLAFDVPGRNFEEVVTAIDRLGRRERSARVKEAVLKHWPEPTVLLPADAPVRRMLRRLAKDSGLTASSTVAPDVGNARVPRPTITDAPGLTWKPRRNGMWEARWAARTDLIRRGYKPKSVGLWTGIDPNAATRAMISDRCKTMQADMLVWGRGGIPQVVVYDGTWSSLIACYRTDEDSTYCYLRYPSRRHYDQLCKTIERDIGADRIRDLGARRVKRLHEAWTAGGKVAIGHSLVGMVRTVLTFGATILECPDCRAAKVLLHDMRFAMAKPRVDRLTADQAAAFMATAHAEGRPSMALAQAFQFECTLRQKDVIGEWVPLDEPGMSDVTSGNDKWLRGIRWEEIDARMILRHVTSKRQKEVEVNLMLAPMVVEELCRKFECSPADLTRSRLPASGPVVIAERFGEPWKAHEFRRLWRVLATKAGIPKGIRNMDSRAGAISEATDAGADLESVRHAATHGDIAMTQRYSRGSAGKIEDVMRLRSAHRNKSGTE